MWGKSSSTINNNFVAQSLLKVETSTVVAVSITADVKLLFHATATELNVLFSFNITRSNNLFGLKHAKFMLHITSYSGM